MKQDTKKKEQKSDLEATDEMAGLKAEFEKVQATPLTRTVTLKYKSCCGCGCSYVDIRRKVPYDSPLKDGDITKTTEKGDRTV